MAKESVSAYILVQKSEMVEQLPECAAFVLNTFLGSLHLDHEMIACPSINKARIAGYK